VGDESRTVADDGMGERGRAAVAGHVADEPAARALLTSPDGGVRATALGALARMGRLDDGDLRRALADPDPAVRRRAVALAVARPDVALVPMLADPDDDVAEQAAWACGEREPAEPGALEALAGLVTGHEDALVREAAVAALGAIGDDAGLPAILAATGDKPAVRRRAVLALAPFEGPEVTAALEHALGDRDWQVRQAAEDLLPPPAGPSDDGA
jgi:HEAT repeat protein